MKDNYRYFVFDYLKTSSIGGYTIMEKYSKAIFSITGKNGRGVFLFLGFISFFVFMAYSFSSLDTILKENNGEQGILDLMFSNIIAIFLAIIFVIILRKLMFAKLEPSGKSINIYSRELPSKLRPAHMRLLLNDGLIDGVSLGSTIIDLIDRGYLEYVKDANVANKFDFFDKNNPKIIRTSKSDESLLKYEKFLINWFINIYGNGSEVSSIEVNSGLLNPNVDPDSEATDLFFEWQAQVLMSFPIDKYYIKRKAFEIIPIICWIVILLSIITSVMFKTTFLSVFFIVFCFGILLIGGIPRILNKAGVDEIGEWLSLKKYLNEFGNMESKTTEMIELWNYYLTYSIALNIPSIAYDEISRFFENNIYFGTINFDLLLNGTQLEYQEKFGMIDYTNDMVSKRKLALEKLKLEIEEEYKKL